MNTTTHTAWRTSSYSANQGNCVEVRANADARFTPAIVAVRDSKDQAGPTLSFAATDWAYFTKHLRHGDPA